MQFITVLSIFFAAASASPLSFNISDYGLGPDLEDYEQELPAIFNLTDYQFGPADLQDVYEEELGGIFKRDDIFNRLQQAAGNNKLASGKSYYFLACQKFLEESETGTLEPGALWVRDQTRWDQSPHGCGHVALVMGTVNKKGSCIKCNQDKTFDGARYLDAVLYPNWKHQNKELRLSDRLVFYYRGEVGRNVKMGAALDKAISAAADKWFRKAKGHIFNATFNCLTFYKEVMEPLVRGQPVRA